MKLYGLQKMTLLDFPGHVACTVFLSGCDFRCPFCHNYELACAKAPAVMEEEAFFSFLNKRRGLLDGVAITGGEPCLWKELPAFLAKIRALGFLTKLDTNGYHPDLLSGILRDHLVDYVAMDIKNSPENYARTAGLLAEQMDMNVIRESIGLLLQGNTDYEFRTTVVSEFHSEEDFYGIGTLINGAGRYFLQPFTDREEVPFAGLHAPTADQMFRYAQIAAPFVQTVRVRGMDGIREDSPETVTVS